MTNQEREKLKSLFIEAYKASACNISLACNKIKVNRRTFYLWRDTDQKFKERIDDAREELIDLVETQVIKNIKDGCRISAFKFLEAQAKHRGYGQQNIKEESVTDIQDKSEEELKQRLLELRQKHKVSDIEETEILSIENDKGRD